MALLGSGRREQAEDNQRLGFIYSHLCSAGTGPHRKSGVHGSTTAGSCPGQAPSPCTCLCKWCSQLPGCCVHMTLLLPHHTNTCFEPTIATQAQCQLLWSRQPSNKETQLRSTRAEDIQYASREEACSIKWNLPKAQESLPKEVLPKLLQGGEEKLARHVATKNGMRNCISMSRDGRVELLLCETS